MQGAANNPPLGLQCDLVVGQLGRRSDSVQTCFDIVEIYIELM